MRVVRKYENPLCESPWSRLAQNVRSARVDAVYQVVSNTLSRQRYVDGTQNRETECPASDPKAWIFVFAILDMVPRPSLSSIS